MYLLSFYVIESIKLMSATLMVLTKSYLIDTSRMLVIISHGISADDNIDKTYEKTAFTPSPPIL